MPNIGDAIEALHNLSGELGETLKQIVNITAELSAKDLIRVEDAQQVGLSLTVRPLLNAHRDCSDHSASRRATSGGPGHEPQTAFNLPGTRAHKRSQSSSCADFAW